MIKIGSYVNYFPLEKWKVEKVTQYCVSVIVGEIHDRYTEPIYRHFKPSNWDLIKSGKVQIIPDKDNRCIHWIYGDRKGTM